MPLVVAQVRLPLSRLGIEVHCLGLLLAVGTTLPGEHHSRVAGLFSRRAGLVHATVPVHQESARNLRQPEVQKRVDVELIPEDVSAIGLTVETASGNARVEVGGVRRADLKYV